MLFTISAALACDGAVLASLRPPSEVGAEPAVVVGGARTGGVDLAGALAVFESRWSVPAWERVLTVPEDQEEWHPAEMGTARVERLDPAHIFQQLDISILWGAFHIRRQIVVGITWKALGDRVENCWQARDPAQWMGAVSPWATDAPWQKVGVGSWKVDPLPDGGSRVSYQFWTEAGVIPTKVQAWAVSRTLPDLMRAYDARVGKLAGE